MLFVDKQHTFFCFYMNSKGENPKRRRMRKKSASHSKILKYIVESLKSEKHQHLLSWADEKNRIFKIKFVHKNNPIWNESFADLFLALDNLISKERYAKYCESPNHFEQSKTRCRANLKKLCESKAISFVHEFKSKDNAKEKIYKISEEKWVLENTCEMKETNSEMNINAEEEKLKAESKVYLFRSDNYSNISALHQENVLGTLQELISSTDGYSEGVACQSKEPLTEIGNVQDTASCLSDIFCDQSVHHSAANILNDAVFENPNVMQIGSEYTEESTVLSANLENMFAQTVSVLNTEISAFPQNIVQNESAPNSDGIMQPSLLQSNIVYYDQAWNHYIHNDADYTLMENMEPSSDDDSIEYISEENSMPFGFPMKSSENPLWGSACLKV